MTDRRDPLSYRPEIDGIRAIAVVSVILLHAGAPIPGGFLGVDIFFVLSGYLITQILARELSTSQFSLLSFYERRIRRILPALLLVVSVSIPLAWWLMPPDQMQAFERSVLALMVFATNIKFFLESGYFAPTAEEIPLLHTWSLAVEEQYYLIFPLLLWALWRYLPGAKLLILALLAFVSLAAAEVAARAWPNAAFYLLPFRAWELLAGAIAGLAVAQSGLPGGRSKVWRGSGRLAGPLSLLGLVLIGGSLALINRTHAIPGVVVLPAILGTVLLLLYAQPGTFAHRVLSSPSMVWIGLVSYSAYLWHQPLFAFARLSQIGHPPPWQMAALVALTFVLAWITWRFVEAPFRNRRAMPLRPMLISIVSASGILFAVGLAGHLGTGVGSFRFNDSEMALLRSGKESPVRATCAEPHGISQACRYFGETEPTWAVFGDSHAIELAYAIAERLRERNESLIQLSRPGCPPALGYQPDPPSCRDWNLEVIGWLQGHPEIRTVVLAWRHSVYLEGLKKLEESTSSLVPAQSRISYLERYLGDLGKVIEAVGKSGVRVILVEPVPEIGVDIDRYALLNGLGDTIPTVSRSFYEHQNKAFFDAAASWNVHRISMNRMCNEKTCFGVKDGVALYYDDNHLSIEGARNLVADLFVETSRIASPSQTAPMAPLRTNVSGP